MNLFKQKLLIKISLILIILLFSSCHSYLADSPTNLNDIMDGKYTIIDLTYPLNQDNAYWPGPSYSSFKYKTVETLENLNCPEFVIDISEHVEHNADYELTIEDIISWEELNGSVQGGSIVLLNTGWWKKWNNYDKYKNADKVGNLHFPGFSRDAARFLVEKRDVKGIGIDTLSADNGMSSDFAVHHILNSAGKYILENVANLDKLPPKGATIIIAPIKIEGGSGGQARIWAILP